jgi:pheromone shutdown protein TraB
VLSILTALVVSPIAVVHPLVATGVVVGAVEAWRRKPAVADLEHLADDLQTFRGAFRNRVTRILILMIASNIGAGVGFFIGVSYVVTS